MPLGESMISSLKSNKSIRLDKTSRFRKTPGGYEKNKTIVYDFPEATPELLESIKSKAIRRTKDITFKNASHVCYNHHSNTYYRIFSIDNLKLKPGTTR